MENILLKIKGNVLGVFPTTDKITKLLKPVTTFQRRQQDPSGQIKMVDNPLYQISDDGTFETLAGLEQRITARLQAYGFFVYVQRLIDFRLDGYIDRLTEEDLANLEGRDDQVNVIGLVVDHPAGFIVNAPTGWGKSYAIAQICKVLPKTKIAVVAPGKEVTRTLYQRLKHQIRDVGRVGDGYRDIRRITVSTMDSIKRLAKAEWDLLLFDEVHRAGGPQVANHIAEVFHSTKCVGFSASPTGRSDNSDLVVEALFGKVIYKVSYGDAAAKGSVVPIRVFMVESNKGPTYGTGTRSNIRNKYGLWRNTERNQLIANVARAVPEDEQCLIMVATADHALQLKKILSEYTVVFSQVSNKKTLNDVDVDLVPGLNTNGSFDHKYRDDLCKKFESGELKKAIATAVWSTGVDFKQLKYLIRAEGIASSIQSIQTPGRLSRTYDGKTEGILFDFMDSFDSALHGRSVKRKKAYTDAGWDVELVEATTTDDVKKLLDYKDA